MSVRKTFIRAGICAVIGLGIAAAIFGQRDAEKSIEARGKAANGINVGFPKIYDDSLLQQMLSAAEGRLTSLQAIDQTSILSHLGSVTGAQQQISGVAISAQGPSLPQIATTTSGATNSVANTQSSANGSTVVTTTGAPAQSVVTTVPQFSPPSASVPAPTTSLPSSFSVSASDVLNEQMQLTYEIANLRLLMEGSLSDWYVEKGILSPKPRTTVGFPITITADHRYENAAAIVEVVVDTDSRVDLSEGQNAPAITALLPREKTYNVAAITDRTVSIGGGMVTQVAGISGSFLWGRKTYYIVKDQDTVARTFDTGNPRQAGFLWEFRPVRVIPGGPESSDRLPVSIPVMKQSVAQVSADKIEDLGGGQMLVQVPGRFLGGTYVRVGMNILGTGTTGFTSEYQLIRFVAPIADLATKRVVVVSRDGTEVPVVIPATVKPNTILKGLEATVTPLDETNSLLRVRIDGKLENFRHLVLVIGGKVFGYSDAPLTKDSDSLSIALPTAFLAGYTEVIVKALLADDREDVRLPLSTASTERERLSYLGQDATYVSYLLFGQNLKDVSIVFPAPDKTTPANSSATVAPLVSGQDDETLQLVKIKATAIKNAKQIVLQRKGERPFEVSVPAPPAAATSSDKTSSDPKFQDRVVVGADEATIVGDGLASIDAVLFGKTALTIADKSDKAIKLKGLAAAMVTTVAKTQEITLTSKAGNTKINLEVVSQKIETVAK